MFVQENEENTNNANTVVTTNQNVNTANTNTTANENTNVNAITSDVDTSDWLTYTNEKYGYSVKYPNSWRLAQEYMEAMTSIQTPNKDEVEDYVVLTAISEVEEEEFIQYAREYEGIAARPWYDFGHGSSIIISPTVSSIDEYMTAESSNVIYAPAKISEAMLPNGLNVTTLQVYSSNDNGEFNYLVALIPLDNSERSFLDIRVENSDDIDEKTFNAIVNSFEIK